MSDDFRSDVAYVSKRQFEIMLKGVSGEKPKIPVRLDQLEGEAQKYMTEGAFSYVATGSGRGTTTQRNKDAFKKWVIIPRVLQNTNNLSTSVEIFGKKHDYPFLLGPLALHSERGKPGEASVGRAAASENIGMVFSSYASTPMEVVAAGMGDCTRWFQNIWTQSERLNESLLRRAEACGCSALVFTIDAPVVGWRTQDLTLGYSPFENSHGMGQYFSDPVFKEMLDVYMKSDAEMPSPKINFTLIKYLIGMARHYPGNTLSNLFSLRPQKALMLVSHLTSERSLTWEEIRSVRKLTKLPIIVKGILNPEDAKLAVKYGMDALVVSNHGGRQLSSAIPSLDALPDVIEAVNGKIPVFMDSGIRGGSDIFKALALGAHAVFIGRPYLFALAIAGEAGVKELIQNLKAEFELLMILSGCKSISEINRDRIKYLP
ncbi:MAG: alpha-hydroxy-acid oxidizing protein [Alphaproteobacteria bacterium]|nr:alpha-hydroxy-acid oxidizing protein [Alphaproteobacteria bacterium]